LALPLANVVFRECLPAVCAPQKSATLKGRSVAVLRSCVVLSVLVFLASNRALAQTPSVDLRTFVTSTYAHGLPYVDAHAYGTDAVPSLVAMLTDRSLEPHWAKIVVTLGFIEDASAVQPLMDFVKQQTGPISSDAFRAILSVLPAVGQIAYRGDPTALQIVMAFVDPGAYRSYGIDFVYSRYHGDAIGEILGRADIMALGVSGRPEALAVLKQMAGDPALRQAWKSEVTNAIDVNVKMSTFGPERVFAKEQ
jgi:hypothetical protein